VALATLLAAGPLLAHGGEEHLTASRVMTWWSFEPGVVVSLAGMIAFYLFGLARLWRNAGRNHGIRVWQVASFFAGWLFLFIALVSPLDALGGVLFSAHMAQHEVLMTLAAPLVVAGRPLIALLWALPPRARLRAAEILQQRAVAGAWRTLSGPAAATLLHAVALWIWHLPSLYEATLRHEGIHALQHLSFFGTAALFWWALMHGRYGRAGYGVAVLYVFFTSAHTGALGALLTLSPHVWYPIYRATTSRWGLDPIEDQQLAGLIMWVPAGVIFLVLGLALFAAWMAESERRVRIREGSVPRT
jgi:putative membrane protein